MEDTDPGPYSATRLFRSTAHQLLPVNVSSSRFGHMLSDKTISAQSHEDLPPVVHIGDGIYHRALSFSAHGRQGPPSGFHPSRLSSWHRIRSYRNTSMLRAGKVSPSTSGISWRSWQGPSVSCFLSFCGSPKKVSCPDLYGAIHHILL